MSEGLVDGGGDAPRVAGEALGKRIEQARIGRIVVAVEIEVKDAALT